jgi:hypothetical protein
MKTIEISQLSSVMGGQTEQQPPVVCKSKGFGINVCGNNVKKDETKTQTGGVSVEASPKVEMPLMPGKPF